MPTKQRSLTILMVVLLAPHGWSVTIGEDKRPDADVRMEIVAVECEEGLRAVVEPQILKSTAVKITKKEPTHKLTLACHWQQSPPHSTAFYSSWGNADLTLRVEHIMDESTLYSESFTEGGKIRGLAMKKAAEAAVAALVRSKVLPPKR